MRGNDFYCKVVLKGVDYELRWNEWVPLSGFCHELNNNKEFSGQLVTSSCWRVYCKTVRTCCFFNHVSVCRSCLPVNRYHKKGHQMLQVWSIYSTLSASLYWGWLVLGRPHLSRGWHHIYMDKIADHTQLIWIQRA